VEPRFDLGALRDISGAKVFARGVAYHEDKRVEISAIDKARVRAKVAGSEIYRTELTGAGQAFSGDCSCRAFTDRGFCKHLVATALAANACKDGELGDTAGRLERVRSHLRSKGVEALVAMIMELAERDTALLRRLELATVADDEDDKALVTRFRKAITEATRTSGFVEYGDVRAWAQGVQTVLDGIDDLLARDRAGVALDLLDHVFTRLERALNEMDDSGGHGGATFARACALHRAACEKARPDSITLARDLFAREVESNWDFFYGASRTYADRLGEAGLAEYRRLAAEAWKKIAPRHAGDRRAHDEDFTARFRLAHMLEDFAERDGDVDARIAVRTKDLSTPRAYLEIARLCLSHGREAEALKWAEEGLWQFDDLSDTHLVIFAADLHERAGRPADAGNLLWRTFERNPSLEIYGRLKAVAGDAEEIRGKAVARLRAEIKGKPPTGFALRGRVELLLRIMMTEDHLAEAWDIVRAHGCSDTLLESLAEASEETHPAEALQAYAKRIDELAGLGGQSNYEAAGQMLGRMRLIRERLGAAADHAAYLADLITRYKAKRNFVKLLRTEHGCAQPPP
jgi:uncharacterized Zn finger protein